MQLLRLAEVICWKRSCISCQTGKVLFYRAGLAHFVTANVSQIFGFNAPAWAIWKFKAAIVHPLKVVSSLSINDQR